MRDALIWAGEAEKYLSGSSLFLSSHWVISLLILSFGPLSSLSSHSTSDRRPCCGGGHSGRTATARSARRRACTTSGCACRSALCATSSRCRIAGHRPPLRCCGAGSSLTQATGGKGEERGGELEHRHWPHQALKQAARGGPKPDRRNGSSSSRQCDGAPRARPPQRRLLGSAMTLTSAKQVAQPRAHPPQRRHDL
jgi:hypothetical protein